MHTKEAPTRANIAEIEFRTHSIYAQAKARLTGKVVEFVHMKTFRDRDHDVTHWEYAPVDFPVISKLVIFND